MVHSESVNLMVSFFLVAGIVIPFVYTQLDFKNRSFAINFQEFINQNHLHPSITEKWKNHQIGVDQEQNKLLYYRNGHYPLQTIIDLNQVKNISLHEHSHLKKMGRSKLEVVDYVGVKIQFTDSKLPAKMLEIYDEKLALALTAERSIANKWLQILQSRIHN